jgi:hypothetical protein
MYGKSFHVKQNGTTSKVKLLLNYYNWIAVQTLLDEWAAFFAHEWLLPEEHIFLTKFKLAFGTQIGISLTLVGTQNTAQRRGETITYSRGGKLVLPCKLVLRDVLLVHHSFWRLPCRVMESLAPPGHGLKNQIIFMKTVETGPDRFHWFSVNRSLKFEFLKLKKNWNKKF